MVLQMTLAAKNAAVFQEVASVPNWSISQVKYTGRLVNMDSKFMNALANGGIEIAAPTYHNQVANSPAGDYVVNISARARSIKSVYAIQRSVASLIHVDNTRNRTDARTKGGMDSYQFNIGTLNYPQVPVPVDRLDGAQGKPEAYVNLYQAMGMQLNHLTSGTHLNQENFNAAEYTAAALGTPGPGSFDYTTPRTLGKYAIGMDFEAFAPGSGLENGLDTSSNNLRFSLDVKRDNLSPIVQIDIYTLVDQFCKIMPDGSISVVR